MKQRHLLLMLFALLGWIQAWADVEINETNFPDANFRTFLLNQSYGSDGVITDAEIATIDQWDVSSLEISSLQGIELFTALTELNCSGNKLTTLDLSKNTALTTLRANDNLLTSIDVTKCTELSTLRCSDNQLTALDVTKNTLLKKLHCNTNQLTSIDLTKNTALEGFFANKNQLSTLDLSNCTALKEMECDNNQLTAINLSNCTALKEVDLDDNNLSMLDVTNCVALKKLNCSGNQLTSIDVSKNTAMTRLDCSGNKLTSIDVSKNTALSTLYCDNNQLTALDVTENTSLSNLYCSDNQLTSLDLSKNTALDNLDCSTNKLSALDVSKNTALLYITCYQNQIKGEAMDAFIASLPIISSGYGQLYIIYLENESNVMTTTQVAAAKTRNWTPYECIAITSYGDEWQEYAGSEPMAESVTINETNFPDANFRTFLLSQTYGSDGVITNEEIATIDQLDVSYQEISNLQGIEVFTALTRLDCSSNKLTALDATKNTQLKRLYCHENKLTSLNVTKNTALTALYCFDNQLTTLDVTENTALTTLDVSINQMTSLDVSKNTALNSLDCSTNQLTALDVSKNTALTIVTCYQNQIKGEAMDAFIASLPSSNGKLYIIYLENESNVMTTTQVAAAKTRNWTPYECIAITSYGDEWQEYAGSEPSGITTIDAEKSVAVEGKFLKDGKIVIRKDGKQYNAAGVLMK